MAIDITDIKWPLKPGSHIPPSYLRRSRRLQLTTFGDLSQWAPAHLRWVADILQFARNRIAQFSTILLLNMDRIVLMKNAAAADDVHIKYIHRRQSPTIADNRRLACKVELSSTSQESRRSMPGTGYVCVGDKCSHMPQRCLRPSRQLRPRYVGGIWQPGL